MSFLKRGQDDAVLVSEGTPFEPSGLIAQWSSKILFSFMTQTDPGNLEADGMKPAASRKMGEWFTVYYNTQVEGAAAMHALGVDVNQSGRKQGPQQVWHLEALTSTILNVTIENLAKFTSSVIASDVRVMTEKSKKYRHELHLIALPKAVQAYAKINGWDVPDLDFSTLTQQVKEGGPDPFTSDELYAKLCGKVDLNSKTFEPLDWESVLGRQRRALWAALGEPDPSKWHGKYLYDEKGARKGMVEGDNLSTTSDKLDEALGLIIAPYTVWARRATVADPRVDALTKDGKRLTLPVLWEFFNSEADARKAATEELAARAERQAAKAGVSVDGNKPPLPEVWKVDEKGFIESIKLYAGKPIPLAAKDLMVTNEELVVWKGYLKL